MLPFYKGKPKENQRVSDVFGGYKKGKVDIRWTEPTINFNQRNESKRNKGQ